MPYVLRGRINKPCQECSQMMEQVATTRLYCDGCYARRQNDRRKKVRGGELHQCATCDEFIPIHKTHCGRQDWRNTCAYKYAVTQRTLEHTKPKDDGKVKGGKKRMERTHLTDQACDSGYF